MKSLRDRRGGFTLIELMIVVAIIGILAAIAIPNFIRFQLRAKASEGKTNLKAISIAEEGYFAEFGTFVPAVANPVGVPGAAKQDWALLPSAEHGFNTIGWAPEGEVFYQYEVAAVVPAPGIPAREFHAVGRSDLDGNATFNEWAYVKPIVGAMNYTGPAPSITACSSNGVYDAVALTVDLLETVGPCDAQSGQSVF